ncbi:MAG: hypothetical protein RIK87_18765 [Fuerstiella sp.]
MSLGSVSVVSLIQVPLWFATGGLFLMRWRYDLWTLNGQVSDENQKLSQGNVSTSL